MCSNLFLFVTLCDSFSGVHPATKITRRSRGSAAIGGRNSRAVQPQHSRKQLIFVYLIFLHFLYFCTASKRSHCLCQTLRSCAGAGSRLHVLNRLCARCPARAMPRWLGNARRLAALECGRSHRWFERVDQGWQSWTVFWFWNVPWFQVTEVRNQTLVHHVEATPFQLQHVRQQTLDPASHVETFEKLPSWQIGIDWIYLDFIGI